MREGRRSVTSDSNDNENERLSLGVIDDDEREKDVEEWRSPSNKCAIESVRLNS